MSNEPHHMLARVPIASVSGVRRSNEKPHIDRSAFDSGCHSGFHSTGEVISSEYMHCDDAAASEKAPPPQQTTTTPSSSQPATKASSAIAAAAAAAIVPSRSQHSITSVTIGQCSNAVEHQGLCKYNDHDEDEDDQAAILNTSAATTATAHSSSDHSDEADAFDADSDADSEAAGSSRHNKMHVDEAAKQSGAKEWTCSGPMLGGECNDLDPILQLISDHDGDKRWRIPNPTELFQYMSMWRACYLKDEHGETLLHRAIRSESKRVITSIIRVAPQNLLLDLRNNDGQCCMHYAVLTSQPLVVRQLRAAGAKPSIRDHYGNTPLHFACRNGDLKCVLALTNPITDVELALFPHAERIPLLPADTSLRNYDGLCCVHLATESNSVAILRHLVHVCKADLNVSDGLAGHTALHMATMQYTAFYKPSSVVFDFLLHECRDQLDLEAETFGRQTAYQLAALGSDEGAMRALLRCGAVERDDTTDEDDEVDDSDEVSSMDCCSSCDDSSKEESA